jgi:hypothetical protein
MPGVGGVRVEGAQFSLQLFQDLASVEVALDADRSVTGVDQYADLGSSRA